MAALVLLLAWLASGTQAPADRPAMPPLPLPFVAAGHEPGWRLDITPTGIVLVAGYGQTRVSTGPREPQPVAGGRRYAGNADGRVLVVTILDRTCADEMTGMPRPHTVVVTLDEEVFRGCGGDAATLLHGAPWVVEAIAGRGLVDRALVTLRFGEDGRVTGTASCHAYTAAYEVTAEGLRIEAPAATRRACSPALAAQEQAFLDTLPGVMRFEMAPDGALILAAGGRTIRARRE